MLYRLNSSVKISSIIRNQCNNCVISQGTLSAAFCSSFTRKRDEKPAWSYFPKWGLIAQWNPLRPLFNKLNLWRYRRYYDQHFDPPSFMDFARDQFFSFTNAVANEDAARLRTIMTPEAFDELYKVMRKNRDCDKEAWRQFMKLNPAEHSMESERVHSVHFRSLRKPFSSAEEKESMTNREKSEQSIPTNKGSKLFEIYTQFACHHDDVQRKQLIKMGYKGTIVERADVFWPLVICHLALGKMASSLESDWLITRAHLLVCFPPAPRRSYMFRVTQAARRSKPERSAEEDEKRS